MGIWIGCWWYMNSYTNVGTKIGTLPYVRGLTSVSPSASTRPADRASSALDLCEKAYLSGRWYAQTSLPLHVVEPAVSRVDEVLEKLLLLQKQVMNRRHIWRHAFPGGVVLLILLLKLVAERPRPFFAFQMEP